MEDSQIVELYWARDEQALTETDKKYGPYCHTISYNILRNRQDVEECINDTYIRAWNAMPPQRPFALGAFLGRIARNVSLHVWQAKHALRRGGGRVNAVLTELSDCVADGPEAQLEARELSRHLDTFLRQLPQKDRCVFVRRYWHLDSIEEISLRYHIAAGSVKSNLFRSRKKLRVYLEKEGIYP